MKNNLYFITYSEYDIDEQDRKEFAENPSSYLLPKIVVAAESEKQAFEKMRLNRMIFPSDFSHPESCIFECVMGGDSILA